MLNPDSESENQDKMILHQNIMLSNISSWDKNILKIIKVEKQFNNKIELTNKLMK